MRLHKRFTIAGVFVLTALIGTLFFWRGKWWLAIVIIQAVPVLLSIEVLSRNLPSAYRSGLGGGSIPFHQDGVLPRVEEFV